MGPSIHALLNCAILGSFERLGNGRTQTGNNRTLLYTLAEQKYLPQSFLLLLLLS